MHMTTSLSPVVYGNSRIECPIRVQNRQIRGGNGGQFYRGVSNIIDMRLHRKWRERWYALKDAFNVVAIVVLIAFAIGAIV